MALSQSSPAFFVVKKSSRRAESLTKRFKEDLTSSDKSSYRCSAFADKAAIIKKIINADFLNIVPAVSKANQKNPAPFYWPGRIGSRQKKCSPDVFSKFNSIQRAPAAFAVCTKPAAG